MARKYSKGSQEKVREEMHEMKRGSGGKVTNPKQAIAIGLSEARKEGEKVPKKSSKKPAPKKSASKKSTVKKSTSKKTAHKKAASTKTTATKKSAKKK